MVRLGGQADKLPGQLSGGQQQRVAIARAIVVEPPLVLMDEPLSNLDAKLRLEMRAEIRRIHSMLGCATIYVTHDQEEALSLADRIVVMIDGQTRQIGTPEELYARPAHPDVAEFMGYRNLPRDGMLIALKATRKPPSTWAARSSKASPGTPMRRRRDGARRGVRPEDCRSPRPATAPIAARRSRDRRVSTAATSTCGACRCRMGRNCGSAPARRVAAGRNGASRSRCPTAMLVYRAPKRSDRAPVSCRDAATLPAPAGSPSAALDGVTLLVLPARASSCWRCSSIPFLYGLLLSFTRRQGGALANYVTFFTEPFLYDTICRRTFWLAVPVTILNVVLSVPVALRVRLMRASAC